MQPQELTRLRTEAGLNKTELAAKIGVSERTVYRWERGASPILPAMENLLRLTLGDYTVDSTPATSERPRTIKSKSGN